MEEQVPAGKVPWLVLTVQNLSDHPLHDNDVDIAYRVTVLQNNKEALRTRLHRQLRHEPGVPDIEFSGMSVGERIDPGATVTRKFDLGKYYELKRPAKYTAYVEILDRSGETLRTNPVEFEMQAPSQ